VAKNSLEEHSLSMPEIKLNIRVNHGIGMGFIRVSRSKPLSLNIKERSEKDACMILKR